MKDYERQILWLEYFNSNLSRREGRRVPLSRAVSNPTLGELREAAERLGLDPEPQEAYHPRRWPIRSGYISIRKTGKKGDILKELALKLASVRGERKA